MPSTTSALVIALPEVDLVLGDLRRAHDPSARDGLPAHVTVLTPYVPLVEWSDTHARRLHAALDGIRPFGARLRRTGRFGDSTLFLVPEPEDVFRRLGRAVAAAFPEYPPYGGAFSEILPHVTLAHGVPTDVLNDVERQVDGVTDIGAQVTTLTLYEKRPGRPWQAGPSVALA